MNPVRQFPTRVSVRLCGLVVLVLLFAGWRLSLAFAPSVDEQLAQHRNLGKAFFENPTTQNEAVAEFKAALDLAPKSARERLNYGLALLHAGKQAEAVEFLKQVQQQDPRLPHTYFNLGIYYKKSGEADDALKQFEQMEKLTPEEPILHYQLGTLYKLQGKAPEATAQLERTVQLDPLLAAARFQLYNLYRQAGRADDAAKALQAFQQLKKQAAGAAIAEDVDWCNYAEIYDPAVPVTPLAPAPQPKIEERVLAGNAVGLVAIDAQGTGETDLLAWSAKGVQLYRKGTEPVADIGLEALTDVVSIAPGDFDNDGFMDLCVVTAKGPLLFRNLKGKFTAYPAKFPAGSYSRAVWIDYDHDYDLDLVLLGENAALLRNEGAAGFADRTGDMPFVKGAAVAIEKTRLDPDSKAFDLAVAYRDHAPVLYRDLLGGRYEVQEYRGKAPAGDNEKLATADFDGNGRADTARVEADGKVRLAFDRSSGSHFMRIRLEGVKSVKLGQDSYVEIKAGELYRRQIYTGVPLVFDTGANPIVDTVRITWSNGLIQNEIKQPADVGYTYKEAQRLSGSCPMIWTWDGQAMQFITDVLGVAPLGASDGEGTYFPVDHDEYVSIPGAALKAVDGVFDVRVTEELSEVSYLDQIQLLAIDHPAENEIFTNEKFKGPPYPDFHLYEVARRIYPAKATDGGGQDVRERILQRDQRYPDQFERTELGVAKLHTLELDFAHAAPKGKATLLLNGWVDWPDGSTFRAAAQEVKGGLVMPYLEMQNAAGEWQTVNEDMGMPAGKPKTIAVPLTFLSASRKVRIVTNLCVYWDEIFLSELTGPVRVRQTNVPMLTADLHFRGFSEAVIHPERKQPDTFHYAAVSPASYWNQTPGFYTRYGAVQTLLGAVDDKLVLMGSGDELKLRFDAKQLPPLPAGWTRDYLLKVDGWAKDRDANTAFGTSVEPLPFHAMSQYPYPAREHFPNDAEHARYRREYNTRPALRLIRPLDISQLRRQ